MFGASRTVFCEMLRNISSKVDMLDSMADELIEIREASRCGWNDKLQECFDNAQTAMIVVEDSMTICNANPKVPEIIGCQPYQIIGKKLWTDLVIAKDIEKVKDFHLNHADADNNVYAYEIELVDDRGAIREVHVKTLKLLVDGQRLLAIIDINDLKAVENALTAGGIAEWKHKDDEIQESKYRFKEIADLLPGIICEFDMSFNCTYVNQKGLQAFCLTKDDFQKGINMFSFIPPQAQAQFEKDIFNIFHDDYGNPGQYRLYRKDKSHIDVIINAAPIIRNRIPVGMRTCIIDISDRVAAEEKLRISEERFRSIYAESPLGIAIFNINGECTEQNRSFRQMFNCDDGHSADDIKLFTFLKLDNDAMQSLQNGRVVNHEAEFECTSGEPWKKKYFDWHITPIGINEPKNAMLLAQVKDITSQKEALDARMKKEKEAAERAETLIAGLRKELREKESFQNMVSRSSQMKQIFDIIPEVAQATATVLVNGESGTGKELVSRSLHELSFRKTKPFIAINCSALPDNLLESELFGYKAGAFTDAKKDKLGKFALAEGGTIFLDEIGDISMAMQVKLLRVLQERVFEPLGATSPVKADVRVIAATNKSLKEMVALGSFREDLFYRINVVTINLPSLNDRRCDIPILCEHFIDRFNFRYNKSIKEISKEAMEIILSHKFPGNIRELENVIEHAFIFCKDSVIEPHHLPMALRSGKNVPGTSDVSGSNNFSELEKIYIKSVIAECKGDRNRAAQRLGIHRVTLFRKMRQYGIDT